MKFLFILLFPLSLHSQVLFSKGKPTKIVVTPTDTTDVYNRVVNSLYEKGYSFEKKDDRLLMTEQRMNKQTMFFYKFRILFSGGTVIFSPLLSLDSATPGQFIESCKCYGVHKIIWNVMVSVAKEFGPYEEKT
jgi:hypothetical protein